MTTTSDNLSIVIPIDVLLETHMGTAALLDPSAPMDIINNGYFKRESNDLWEYTDKFTKEEYLKKWKERNVETLKASVVRNIVEFMNKMIQTKLAESADRGGDLKVTVIINGFPYAINEKVQKYMCFFVDQLMYTLAEVKISDFSNDELTIHCLKSNDVLVLFLNDFNEWLPLHYKELADNPYPRLEVYTPMIIKDIKAKVKKAIDDGTVDSEIVNEISPYKAAELSFAKFLALNFLSIDFFSVPSV